MRVMGDRQASVRSSVNMATCSSTDRSRSVELEQFPTGPNRGGSAEQAGTGVRLHLGEMHRRHGVALVRSGVPPHEAQAAFRRAVDKTRRTLTPPRATINGLNLLHFSEMVGGSRTAPIVTPRIVPSFAPKSAR
jgi:hypothetical protein